MAKIKGIEFDFPDGTLILPPLSLGDLELLQERLATLDLSKPDKTNVGTAIDAAHAALTRNYPEMTRAQVAKLIGLENMIDVLEAVMDVSGLKRKQIEAAKKAESAAGSSSN